MLLDSIRSLLRPSSDSREPASRHAPGIDPVHLAACAILLDIAYADGEFSESERTHLESVLERHFGLPPEAGRQLIALADTERRKSIDHFHFASVLRQNYDVGQKMVLAEVMWGLVLADGQIADHEHYLTRKIANLLELEPGYLSSAKAAAAQRSARTEELPVSPPPEPQADGSV
jgi:uncharacterized tellurite resistance protein B-like protein